MAIFQENKKASFQDAMKTGCLPNVKASFQPNKKTIILQRKQALFVGILKAKQQTGMKASKKTIQKYFLLSCWQHGTKENYPSICTDGNQ